MSAQSVTLLANTPFVTTGVDGSNGLTYSYTIPSTGMYRISLQTTTAPSSSLVITVKQNGTTKYTAPTLTPTQTSLQFTLDLLCTAADAITVNLTSTAAIDQALNTIQTTCSIGNGL